MTKAKAAPKAEPAPKAAPKRTDEFTRKTLAAALERVGIPGTKAYEAIDAAFAHGISFSHSGGYASEPVGSMVLSGETAKNYARQHGEVVEEDAVAVDSDAGVTIAAGGDADADSGEAATDDGDSEDAADVTEKDAPATS